MRFTKILLTTAVIAFSGAAFAQGFHGGHEGGELFHGISLTDAQKSEMKTIQQAPPGSAGLLRRRQEQGFYIGRLKLAPISRTKPRLIAAGDLSSRQVCDRPSIYIDEVEVPITAIALRA